MYLNRKDLRLFVRTSTKTLRRTSKSPHHYILLNKPYQVLCQFTDAMGGKTLADFGPFPTSVYPVGRLDAESEGLLLLTDDNHVKHRLTDPQFGHPRTYFVQVEHIPSEQSLQRLREGVLISGKRTKPAEVFLLSPEPSFPSRPVPIRFRKNIPTAWLSVTLREGRNHQVRRMTASVGHPTLRLIRVKIGDLSIEGIAPGKSRPLSDMERMHLLDSVGKSMPRRDDTK